MMFVFRLFLTKYGEGCRQIPETGNVKEPAWADIAKLSTQGTCADEP